MTDQENPEAAAPPPAATGEGTSPAEAWPEAAAGTEPGSPPAAAAPAEAAAASSPTPPAPEPAGAAAAAEAPGPEYVEIAPAPLTGPTTSDRPTVIVRFGAMGILGRFVHSLDHWRCGQKVVIKSDRGQEIGEIVCAWGGCGSPAGVPPQIRGEILRPITHADEVEARHLADSERRELQFCKQCIVTRQLPMKLVAAEHLFGGDRIVFYFVSEARVDFRALVRDLAHEFQTRIEMRQIGVRDEARLLGDYERCGRPLCCRAWIKELEPVSMKMAKVQKATLDPTKISGRCGRLMCCLRFEHETYRELSKNLPRKNTLIGTPDGPGKVLNVDVISQVVSVLLMTGTRINVPVERVTAVGAVPAAAPAAPAAEAGDVRMEPRAARPPRPAAPPAAEAERRNRKRRPSNRPPTSRAPLPPEVPVAAGQPAGQEGRPPGQEGRGRRRRRGRRGRHRGRQDGGGNPQGQGGQGRPNPSGGPPACAATRQHMTPAAICIPLPQGERERRSSQGTRAWRDTS